MAPQVLPHAAAVLTTLGLQIGFSWKVYREIGDLTIAQVRYYNVLRPAAAVAGAAMAMQLSQRWPRAPGAIVLACLLPTMLGLLLSVALPRLF